MNMDRGRRDEPSPERQVTILAIEQLGATLGGDFAMIGSLIGSGTPESITGFMQGVVADGVVADSELAQASAMVEHVQGLSGRIEKLSQVIMPQTKQDNLRFKKPEEVARVRQQIKESVDEYYKIQRGVMDTVENFQKLTLEGRDENTERPQVSEGRKQKYREAAQKLNFRHVRIGETWRELNWKFTQLGGR